MCVWRHGKGKTDKRRREKGEGEGEGEGEQDGAEGVWEWEWEWEREREGGDANCGGWDIGHLYGGQAPGGWADIVGGGGEIGRGWRHMVRECIPGLPLRRSLPPLLLLLPSQPLVDPLLRPPPPHPSLPPPHRRPPRRPATCPLPHPGPLRHVAGRHFHLARACTVIVIVIVIVGEPLLRGPVPCPRHGYLEHTQLSPPYRESLRGHLIPLERMAGRPRPRYRPRPHRGRRGHGRKRHSDRARSRQSGQETLRLPTHPLVDPPPSCWHHRLPLPQMPSSPCSHPPLSPPLGHIHCHGIHCRVGFVGRPRPPIRRRIGHLSRHTAPPPLHHRPFPLCRPPTVLPPRLQTHPLLQHFLPMPHTSPCWAPTRLPCPSSP